MDRAKWELLQALVCLVLPLIMLAVYLLWIFAYLVARILGLEPPAGRFARLFAILPPSLGGPLGFTRPPPDALPPPPPVEEVSVYEYAEELWEIEENSVEAVVANPASVYEYAEGLWKVAEGSVEAVVSADVSAEQASIPAVALTERFDDLQDEAVKTEIALGLYGADFPEEYDGDALEPLREVVDEFVKNVTSVEWWVDTLTSELLVDAFLGTAPIALLESLLKKKADREKKRGKHREAVLLGDRAEEYRAVREFFEKLWNDLHVSKAMAVQIEENTGIPRKRLGEILRCFADHTPPCYWQLRGLIMSQESD